jgi:hypothetical protein
MGVVLALREHQFVPAQEQVRIPQDQYMEGMPALHVFVRIMLPYAVIGATGAAVSRTALDGAGGITPCGGIAIAIKRCDGVDPR